MKSFLKFTSKLFVTSICAVILCVSALAYNPRGAIDYAKGHWSDGKGLCAEFASDCLISGDMRFSPATDRVGGRVVSGSRGYYYWGCWGLFNDLKARTSEIVMHELNTDASGRIPWSGNEGKVKPGDVLFIKDLHPDDVTDTYTHVVIVGDQVNPTYVTMYGHNNDRNNEVLCVNPSTERWVCAHFIR